MSRQVSWLCAVLLLVGVSVASAQSTSTCESTEVRDLMKDLGSDSRCEKKAWTAVSSLPGVRIVVYDPISNSFSFTTCSGEETPNEEFLDRRRLALATQKIRLLVLPYNPANGDIQVETADGKGTEFAATSVAGTATPAAAAESEKKGEEAKPKTSDQKPPQSGSADQALTAATTVQSRRGTGKAVVSQSNAQTQSFSSNYAIAPDVVTKIEIARQSGESATDPVVLLTIIRTLFETYSGEVNEARDNLIGLRTDTECVDRHLDDQPRSLGVDLANDQTWTPARDNRLCTVLAEAVRRQKRIKADGYKPCFQPNQSFEEDVRSLTKKRDDVSGRLTPLQMVLDEIGRNVDRLESIDPSPLKPAERSQLVKSFRRQIAADQKYLDGLGTDMTDVKKTFDGALKKRATFTARQGSQAATLHTEIYPPIENDHSMTIKINRIEPDGHRSDHPIAQLELRSAPVYNVRFGMGLVVSQLKDPTFKAGVVPASAQASSPAKADTTPAPADQKRVVFDDEGGGRVMPSVFVHHYWWRRSPLLQPTKFEKWIPTFSLGIPLAKADLLTQALFGLDWELTPGVEINAGMHYGKVNHLTGGYEVGDLLNGVDLGSIQKKTFKWDLYFGVVVNADTFNLLMNSQTKAN